MNKVLLIISGLLLSLPGAYAASEKGNGGDGVACYDASGNLESFELLDLYEAKSEHRLELVVDVDATTPEEAAHFQLDKIKVYAGRDGWSSLNSYRERIDTFFGRVDFVDEELEDISDSLHTIIPENCKVHQVAINYIEGNIEINRGWWEKLDDINKGALILHELLYEDYIMSHYSNSIEARRINAFIHGNHEAISTVIRDRVVPEFLERVISSQIPESIKADPFLAFEAAKSTPLESIKERLSFHFLGTRDIRVDERILEFLTSEGLDSLSLRRHIVERVFWTSYVTEDADFLSAVMKRLTYLVKEVDHESLNERMRQKVLIESRGIALGYLRMRRTSKYNISSEEFLIIAQTLENLISFSSELNDPDALIIKGLHGSLFRAELDEKHQEEYEEILVRLYDNYSIERYAKMLNSMALSYKEENGFKNTELEDMAWDSMKEYGYNRYQLRQLVHNTSKHREIAEDISERFGTVSSETSFLPEMVKIFINEASGLKVNLMLGIAEGFLRYYENVLSDDNDLSRDESGRAKQDSIDLLTALYKKVGSIKLTEGLKSLILREVELDYYSTVLKLLFESENITDKIIDRGAYEYRHGNKKAYEIMLEYVTQPTPYLHSVIRQELLRNKQSEDKLMDALTLLERFDDIGGEKTRTILLELVRESPFIDVKTLSEKLLAR